MGSRLITALDNILDRSTTGEEAVRVPGVAAIATATTGSLYEGAAGTRSIGGDEAMTTDTVCALFSATKALTAATCLTLVEDGLIELDAPAQEYAPRLGEIQVLDGFDQDGQPRLRSPKREITTRMLLLHTAGFGYDFFNADLHRLATEHGQPDVSTATQESLLAPLLFDPGERWEYGISLDWVGRVIEGASGRSLDVMMSERLLDPLGMTSTAWALTNEMRSRKASIHMRKPDGSLKATSMELARDPEILMGGQGLYSTVDDFARFIRMWLADGKGPAGPILRPETIEMASVNGLGDLKMHLLPSQNPALTHDAEFFPGIDKSWAMSFMVNDAVAPTGRSPGSLAWAGLANFYYWIDRHRGLGGIWATQILPFFDPVSLDGALEFETAVYRHTA